MAVKTPAVLCLFILLAGKGASAQDAEKQLLPDKDSCGHQKSTNDMSAGKSAELTEFPWVVLLRYNDQEGKNAGYRCVGSLISPRYVLTTAVCATPLEVTLAEVRLGEYNLTTAPDCVQKGEEKQCGDAAKDVAVEKAVAHADFKRANGDNDIALIKLKEEVAYSDYIKPICLPLSGATNAQIGDTVASSGWGRTITGELITVKKRVISSVITNEECQKDIGDMRKITENHLCTKAFRNNTAFTCSGDSGGPLMHLSGEQWQQHGIVSFGKGCGYMFADASTKVANYIEWIKENMLK